MCKGNLRPNAQKADVFGCFKQLGREWHISRATIHLGCSELAKTPSLGNYFLKSCINFLAHIKSHGFHHSFSLCRSKSFQMHRTTKFFLLGKTGIFSHSYETTAITELQKARKTVFCPLKIQNSLFCEDRVLHKPDRIKSPAQRDTGILNRSG